MMKAIGYIVLGLIGVIALLGSLFLNIAIHEVGHYGVADTFGLEPEIYLRGPFVKYDGNTVGFVGIGTPDARVSYLEPSSGAADAVVAFGGPFVNIMLSIFFAGLYLIMRNRSETTRIMILLMLIPSLLSVMFNLVPVTGTDGAAMLAALS